MIVILCKISIFILFSSFEQIEKMEVPKESQNERGGVLFPNMFQTNTQTKCNEKIEVLDGPRLYLQGVSTKLTSVKIIKHF